VDKLNLIVVGKPAGHWWRVVTAAFTYDNAGVAFAVLGTVAVFGWLIERRHGPLPVLVLFGIGAVGGVAATALVYPFPVVLGGNGGALALLSAWAVGQLFELRESGETDADLIGAAVIAAVVALTPLVDANVSWLADGLGVLTGATLGLALTVLRRA
jgi:membrane associated rhomboid family serine protease